MQWKEEKALGCILSSAMHEFNINCSDITLPAFGRPVNVSLTTAKRVRKYYTSDGSVNPLSLRPPTDRKMITDF